MQATKQSKPAKSKTTSVPMKDLRPSKEVKAGGQKKEDPIINSPPPPPPVIS